MFNHGDDISRLYHGLRNEMKRSKMEYGAVNQKPKYLAQLIYTLIQEDPELDLLIALKQQLQNCFINVEPKGEMKQISNVLYYSNGKVILENSYMDYSGICPYTFYLEPWVVSSTETDKYEEEVFSKLQNLMKEYSKNYVNFYVLHCIINDTTVGSHYKISFSSKKRSMHALLDMDKQTKNALSNDYENSISNILHTCKLVGYVLDALEPIATRFFIGEISDIFDKSLDESIDLRPTVTRYTMHNNLKLNLEMYFEKLNYFQFMTDTNINKHRNYNRHKLDLTVEHAKQFLCATDTRVSNFVEKYGENKDVLIYLKAIGII